MAFAKLNAGSPSKIGSAQFQEKSFRSTGYFLWKTGFYARAFKPLLKEWTKPNDMNNPFKAINIFISYCWEGPGPDAWVAELAGKICSNSTSRVEVVYDRKSSVPGNNIFHTIQEFVNDADIVIMVLSAEYKRRADDSACFVGYEYNLIRQSMVRKNGVTKKYIPVLRSGTINESIPADLAHFVFIDMSGPGIQGAAFEALMRSVDNPSVNHDTYRFTEPGVEKPSLPPGTRDGLDQRIFFTVALVGAAAVIGYAMTHGGNPQVFAVHYHTHNNPLGLHPGEQWDSPTAHHGFNVGEWHTSTHMEHGHSHGPGHTETAHQRFDSHGGHDESLLAHGHDPGHVDIGHSGDINHEPVNDLPDDFS